MTRIKRGVMANKRRKAVLKLTRGFKWRRKSHFRAAKEATLHAGRHAYIGRKQKKRTQRNLWILRVGNAAKEHNTSYSKLAGRLAKSHIKLNRKMLSEIAIHHPDIFSRLISA